MKRRAFLVALVATLAATRPMSANANKLLNPGFDGGTLHWTFLPAQAWSTLYSASVGHLSPGSLVIAANGSTAIYSVVTTQIVNVNPGAVYSFGAYFLYSADSATEPRAQVEVRWYSGLDGAGAKIDTYVSPLTPTGSAATWLLSQMTIPAPAQALSARVDLVMKTTESKSALGVFDDPFAYGGVSGGVIGDANGDGKIDIADVFFLINHLFSNGPLPIGPSDVNADFEVDVSDAFYLINYLFGGGNPPLE
jgi:hypothetical protein